MYFDYSYSSTLLGNENINKIVARTNYSLRVDMEQLDNTTAFAVYQTFKISDESSSYTLTIFDYSGNASKFIMLMDHNNLEYGIDNISSCSISLLPPCFTAMTFTEINFT